MSILQFLAARRASETCYRESLSRNEKLRIIMVYSLHRYPALHRHHNPADRSISFEYPPGFSFIIRLRAKCETCGVSRTAKRYLSFFFFFIGRPRVSSVTYRDFSRVLARARWCSRARILMEISLHHFESERERQRKRSPDRNTCTCWTACNSWREPTLVKLRETLLVPIFFSIRCTSIQHCTRSRVVAALSNDELAVSRFSAT